jgi:quinol-cytochrome oxidoreductase complex cytochrome b subunit
MPFRKGQSPVKQTVRPREQPRAAPARPSLARRIWDSAVLRGPVVPRTDRDRAFVTVHTLLLHLRPVKVPARAIRFTHTFGLGGSSLVLITLLALTGLLLTLVYQPASDVAYDSVVAIERDVAFGTLVRGMHHWSANLLMLVMLAHAARVFLTGGYHGPRQFNWMVGCALALLVLASAFTGYLLPWDQRAYWAVTISTGMLSYVPVIGDALRAVARGGADIGPNTLPMFYTVHTSIAPALLVFVLAFHFWRVRKAGGVVVPPPRPGEGPGDEKVLFLPHLLVREAMLALVIAAAIVVLATALATPLGDRANAGMSPNPAKAPWYFMGIQELLVHVHPVAAVVVVPGLAMIAVLLLPYFTSNEEREGTWFLSERGRRAAADAALLAPPLTLAAVVAHELAGRGVASGSWLGPLLGGAVPVGAVVLAVAMFSRVARSRHGLSPNETTQAVVVLLAMAFATLTLVGVWFRGQGMGLAWPWPGGQ